MLEKEDQERLIEYVMLRADACYSDDFPIMSIETWIREFFENFMGKK